MGRRIVLQWQCVAKRSLSRSQGESDYCQRICLCIDISHNINPSTVLSCHAKLSAMFQQFGRQQIAPQEQLRKATVILNPAACSGYENTSSILNMFPWQVTCAWQYLLSWGYLLLPSVNEVSQTCATVTYCTQESQPVVWEERRPDITPGWSGGDRGQSRCFYFLSLFV